MWNETLGLVSVSAMMSGSLRKIILNRSNDIRVQMELRNKRTLEKTAA
jgi:hypothetical protein